MTVRQIDPIQDPRWELFLERHPRASVFHTPGWLEALRRTYGYESLALTTAGPGEDLSNGLVFCRVKSWLTGRRTVSLPFSDHCEPLVETEEELTCILSALKRDLDASKAKYIEIRPVRLLARVSMALEKADSYCSHQLDLRPSLDELFKGFHKDCVQRKIRRAEREALCYEEGNSESLLARFYRLLVLTRQRQQLPPQPLAWFRNLITSMGAKLKIRLVSKDGHPVASILTFGHKDTLVYKYGCSDDRFNNLGGTHLLFWKAIQDAKSEKLLQFDLGRSDFDQPGLIAFKDRWGAGRSVLSYWRFSARPVRSAASSWPTHLAKRLIGVTPSAFLPLTGRVVYRHLA